MSTRNVEERVSQDGDNTDVFAGLLRTGVITVKLALRGMQAEHPSMYGACDVASETLDELQKTLLDQRARARRGE